tara:strand:+ start:54 stop:266 length:213 start_codon:yes stop_codon:yes gene_type:complete
MNKETVKAVSRRILQTMKADEELLKILLATETNGVPERQLGGLIIKIEQQLGRVMANQNKLMLLQDITDQ